MLSIGRALMTHPELLVLDEATEGLAPLIADDIWRVIGEVRQTGIATLIYRDFPTSQVRHRFFSLVTVFLALA